MRVGSCCAESNHPLQAGKPVAVPHMFLITIGSYSCGLQPFVTVLIGLRNIKQKSRLTATYCIRRRGTALTFSFKLFTFYCASEIRTCTPLRVVVIGAEVAIFGITLFCSK
jgi:hypothetical protein